MVEYGLADDIVSGFRSVLSPYFDEVGEAYIYENKAFTIAGGRTPKMISLIFNVKKYGRRTSVEFPVKITDWEVVFGTIGRCVNTGIEFNLTEKDVREKLFFSK